jgi:hypothetical protein
VVSLHREPLSPGRQQEACRGTTLASGRAGEMPWLRLVWRWWRLSVLRDDDGGLYVRWARGHIRRLLPPLRS